MANLLGGLALEYGGMAAEKYNELSTFQKFGIASGLTIISPVFWIIFVVVVIITSLIIWWLAPCWIRNEKDPNVKECNGYKPPSFWRSLLISALIVFLPLFLIKVLITMGAQQTVATIVSNISGK